MLTVQAVTATRTPTASPTATPTATVPPPPPIRYAGVPAVSSTAGWMSDSKLWLGIPHRTQFDASVYAQTNCGPTSLGMILEAYGLKNYATDALRGEVNRIQGNSDPHQGTSLPAIAAVAQRAGLYPVGMYSRPGVYARWTIDDLRASLNAGRPIIMLTRYGDLPGNGAYEANTNHYIVLSGLSGDQLIYNDAAYPQGRGIGLLIAPETLKRASERSVIPGQGVAFALRADGAGLLQPDRLRSDEPEEDEIELADEEDLINAAMDDAALDSQSLAMEDVAAFVPGYVDESQLYPISAPTSLPTPQVRIASSSSGSGPSAGFPLGRAAAILGLVMLGAYAPGAAAIIIGHIRQ